MYDNAKNKICFKRGLRSNLNSSFNEPSIVSKLFDNNFPIIHKFHAMRFDGVGVIFYVTSIIIILNI